MKALDYFVVELDKLINDTIETSNGVELFLDSRFNEFDNRVVEGPVVSVPHKYDTPVRTGDTLYFHHHVVVSGGNAISDDPRHFWVKYDPQVCINNHAIAYKDQDSGEIFPLGEWCLMNPVGQEKDFASEIVEIIQTNRRPPKTAELWKGNALTEEMDLEEGTIVGFRKNMDYSIKIDGKERYRVDANDLLFVYND